MTPIASIPAVSPTKVGKNQPLRSMRRMGPSFGLVADSVYLSKQNAYGPQPALQNSFQALTDQQVKAFFVPNLQTQQPLVAKAPAVYVKTKPASTHFPQSVFVEQYERKQDVTQNRLKATQARWLMNKVASQIRPGMTESAAKVVANRLFLAYPEVEAIWKQPVFRFGPNTQVPPNQKIKQEHVLQPNDIFTVEIAPVFTVQDKGPKMIESAAGETFLVRNGQVLSADKLQGFNDPQARLVKASRTLFNDALTFWRKENPEGFVLNEYMKRRAQELGYLFTMEPAGHLTGLFPHAEWFPKLKDEKSASSGANGFNQERGLGTYLYTPNDSMWMLEGHLRDPRSPYGAFYKGLLK